MIFGLERGGVSHKILVCGTPWEVVVMVCATFYHFFPTTFSKHYKKIYNFSKIFVKFIKIHPILKILTNNIFFVVGFWASIETKPNRKKTIFFIVRAFLFPFSSTILLCCMQSTLSALHQNKPRPKIVPSSKIMLLLLLSDALWRENEDDEDENDAHPRVFFASSRVN